MLPRNLGRKKRWLRQSNTNSGHFLSYSITATRVYIRKFLFHLYSQRVLNLSKKSRASWLKKWQMCEFRLVFTHTSQLASLLRMLGTTLSLLSYRTTFWGMQELSQWIFCPRGQQESSTGHCWASAIQSKTKWVLLQRVHSVRKIVLLCPYMSNFTAMSARAFLKTFFPNKKPPMASSKEASQ